ncbi:uncharacterized protein LOC126162153 isoform X2 [Schistocerca cancellata]|uniref:uncharacterized protein LOC126162153 isoform X2 n=1 Tax=Schistocerca cancellata TaxID=274614 RepID=UPI002117CDEE|nr:uncharacterized protein LOC126162153 isoform X2 [Schistocerca cancellata]
MDRTAASQLLFLACSVIVIHQGSSAECSVNVNSPNFPSPQPLLLNPNADRDLSSFLAPDARGDIVVSEGTQLLFACPDSGFKLIDAQTLNATCVSGTVFSVDGTAYTLSALACKKLPSVSAVNTSAQCDVNNLNAVKVQIGFTVEEEFYKLYEVCFDTEELTPLYTKATVIAGIKGFQTSFPRPDQWEQGQLYGSVDMSNQYRTQRDTLVNLLGVTPENMSKNYLSRGHLAAKADFALGVQQSASFHYANSAPQWYAFNSGNWNQLELDVRDFASKNNFDLEVYTGTYGTLQLEDKNGNQTDIYLYVGTSGKKVPVPKLFWKVVYEPKSKRAIVFVGVNNPYLSSSKLPEEYKLCKQDACRVNWLHWKPTNQTAGRAYCCEYVEFNAKVPYLDLAVEGTFSLSGAESTSALKLMTIACSVWLLVRLSYN